MIKSKKKPNKTDIMNSILNQMKKNDQMKKRHYHEQEVQKQINGYKQETKRLEDKKLKQKEQQKKKRMFYY